MDEKRDKKMQAAKRYLVQRLSGLYTLYEAFGSEALLNLILEAEQMLYTLLGDIAEEEKGDDRNT